MPRECYENKRCSLISEEDNYQVFELLGVRCLTLATTIVQLYLTEPPNHSEWLKSDTGILCFVKDSYRRSYFFQLYCLSRNAMIWEHEIYKNMEYESPCEFFHTFEGEGCMIALNFVNIMEAKELKEVVNGKLLKQKKNEAKRNLTRHRSFFRRTTQNASRIQQELDVRQPTDLDFRIRYNDPQVIRFLEKAGITAAQLQDEDTRKFIWDFIETHGGLQQVRDEIPPPLPPKARRHRRSRSFTRVNTNEYEEFRASRQIDFNFRSNHAQVNSSLERTQNQFQENMNQIGGLQQIQSEVIPPLPPKTKLPQKRTNSKASTSAVSNPQVIENSTSPGASTQTQISQPFIEEKSKCSICLEEGTTHLVVPCGHKIYCRKCSQLPLIKTIRRCPVCNGKQTMVIMVRE